MSRDVMEPAKAMLSPKRKHGRESAEVKLPVLPAANQFRAWNNPVYQKILQASGREDDKGLAWKREVERDGARPEDMAERRVRDRRAKDRSVSDDARHW